MISDITTESEFISDVLCVGGPIDGKTYTCLCMSQLIWEKCCYV